MIEPIKPKIRTLIFRHGESKANRDLAVHETTNDMDVELTYHGIQQSYQLGKFISAFFRQPEILEEHKMLAQQRLEVIEARTKFLKDNPGFGRAFPEFANIPKPLGNQPKVFMYFSPFKRTQQTAGGILKHADDVVTHCKEHVSLHERQFGLHEGYGHKLLHEAFPHAARFVDRANEAGDAIYFANLLMGESLMQAEIRAKEIAMAIDRRVTHGDCYNFILVSHSIQARVQAKVLLKSDVSAFREDEKPGNTWGRYIEGLHSGTRTDHGWIYTGKKSEVRSIQATAVRTR